MFVLPLLFWCIHKQLGIAVGYLAMFSAWTNDSVKYIFSIPRPADPRLHVPLPETSPSFPSGHAQNALAVWGYLAYRVRHWAFTVVAVVVILGISLSRIVLGVHFPQDVLGGWLIGLVLLVVFVAWAPAVGRWLARQTMALQLALAVAVPLVLIFAHPADTEGLYPAEGAITPMAALDRPGCGAGHGAGLGPFPGGWRVVAARACALWWASPWWLCSTLGPACFCPTRWPTAWRQRRAFSVTACWVGPCLFSAPGFSSSCGWPSATEGAALTLLTTSVNLIGLAFTLGLGLYLVTRSPRSRLAWLAALTLWCTTGFFLHNVLLLHLPGGGLLPLLRPVAVLALPLGFHLLLLLPLGREPDSRDFYQPALELPRRSAARWAPWPSRSAGWSPR